MPARSPYFDGTHVTLVAARGETIGLEVLHRGGGGVALAIDRAVVRGFAVTPVHVATASTEMYGGSHGAGDYPDVLAPATGAIATDPAYFTIAVARDAAPGPTHGTLTVGVRTFDVTLAISPVTLPPLPETVWAYYDPRELDWAKLGTGTFDRTASPFGGAAGRGQAPTVDAPSPEERACIAMFAERGVLLSPDLPIAAWPARKQLVTTPFVPARISDDPARVGDDVRAWIAATQGTGQVPFAIPIDEPHGAEALASVRALAQSVRAAGGGAGRFVYAVTADPSAELGDVDLVITPNAKLADTAVRWTYNGAPPRAGAMVVDAESPGPRTWGWIAWRYHIPVWYVWDALYWHDRHNAKRAHQPLPGRALDAASDARSFDDGEDHGNLDGVLAMPGDAQLPCKPTLQLESLRRGLEDRQLLELAAACAPGPTAELAAKLVPAALGDAGSEPSWPRDEAAWEAARRELLRLATPCAH